MFRKELVKLKFLFTLLTATVLLLLVIGVGWLQKNGEVLTDSMMSLMRSLGYRMEYTLFSNRAILASEEMNYRAYPPVDKSKNAVAVPVLVYHGILDEADGTETNISRSTFKQHMYALKEAGFTTINTEDLVLYLEGKKDIPDRSIMITFDDGRRDNYIGADPVLRALGFQAVMFVITETLDAESDYYISPNDIRRMHNTGRWDIQAHTHNGHHEIDIGPGGERGHYYSARMWLPQEGRKETEHEYRARVIADLQKTKDILAGILEKDIHAFAFPFGDFGQNEVENTIAQHVILEESAKLYDTLFYQEGSGYHFSANNLPRGGQAPFLVRRINGDPTWSGERLVSHVIQSSSKALPYTDDLSTDHGWIRPWGQLQFDNSALYLRADEGESGETAILDGTGHWTDYDLRATVDVPLRNNAFIWVRLIDEDNNASCNFGAGFAHVEQVVEGERRVIKGLRGPEVALPSGEFELGARVVGRYLQCLINGRVVVESEFLDTSLTRGGIGFKTFDATRLGASTLIIHDLVVDPVSEPIPTQVVEEHK